MEVSLKDIGTIITGNTPSKKDKKYWDSKDICFVKPDIIGDDIDSITNSNEYISNFASSKARIVKRNTILITCIGNIGRIGIVSKEKIAFNQQINAIIPNSKINLRYLAYVLLFSRPRLKALANAAVVPIVNKTQLESFKIEIDPELEHQDKIANTLDEIEKIKKIQNKEIEYLDTLIKARFVEMFGDPICNSKNKSTTKFINVVKLQRGFDLPIRKRNTQGKIPVYGSNGVLGYHDEFKASSGIITGRSGTIGKVYYENNEFWPLNTALFSVKTYGNNIIYLKYLVSLFKLERFCNGAGVPTLNRNNVHKQKIIDIPIKEQNKFASFVQQVDKSKVVNASIMKYIISIRFYLYFKENKEGAR
ncbi:MULTISPECIES: restriction endonuclease subunit S [unclassified Lactobacillus]|uniref:restriction endonuclease subunit S n=1 Tax=unclassified Lactobacillus TaxID=2620435 RepID=UPI00130400EE|nr:MULTISPECIES: restriction endonuclease subunit S [unclassified Lactobacillus]